MTQAVPTSSLSLKDLLTPRASVFDSNKADTVLDLKDLIEGRIPPEQFFQENHITAGLGTLLEQAFRRFAGDNDNGVFLMRQSMGGGKTHSLITLGLLAQHPLYRNSVIVDPERFQHVGKVQVVAFDGRESDAKYGIWGAIAEQFGQRDVFQDCYSPLQAPGVSAWEKLLTGRTALILLDELPPYMDGAESRTIGDSNLARVTAQALSNLFNALQRPGCRNVCLVMTDLAATSYANSGHYLRDALANLQKEAGRIAVELEPVKLNSGELYDILRVRLFEAMPDPATIQRVAQEYAGAVDDARRMGLTGTDGQTMLPRLIESYPFHPLLRDLYARFKANKGFQQTRGLIRLMRGTIASMWAEEGQADERHLIAVQDINLDDDRIRNEIYAINPDLQQAVAHDVSDHGSAVAERLDPDGVAAEAARLVLISSLSNVVDGITGLNLGEVIDGLARPGLDISAAKTQLDTLASKAWYLHRKDNHYRFDTIQNVNAVIETTITAMTDQQGIERVQKQLQEFFNPSPSGPYASLLVFPHIDQIQLSRDRVTLVVARPDPAGLNPDLLEFYCQSSLRNRVMFLTGDRNNYNQLLDAGRRLRGIEIVGRRVQDSDKVSTEQKQELINLMQAAQHQFREAARNCFTQLYFPQPGGLKHVDFNSSFAQGQAGADQIRDLLTTRGKFVETFSDTQGRMFETRVFSVPRLTWNEILDRAALTDSWVWHPKELLDELLTSKLDRDEWRRDGDQIFKGPFEAEHTSVTVLKLGENRDKGTYQLEVTGKLGSQVHYATGTEVSGASPLLTDSSLETSEPVLSFLAVDPAGKHPTGDAFIWRAPVHLTLEIIACGENRFARFGAPKGAEVRCTFDGSSPESGAVVAAGEELTVPAGTLVVQGIATRAGSISDRVSSTVDWTKEWKVNPQGKAVWQTGPREKTTAAARTYIDRLKKHQAQASGVLLVVEDGGNDRYARVQFGDGMTFMGPQLDEVLSYIRKQVSDAANVSLTVKATVFERGQDLLDWTHETGDSLKAAEVKQ